MDPAVEPSGSRRDHHMHTWIGHPWRMHTSPGSVTNINLPVFSHHVFCPLQNTGERDEERINGRVKLMKSPAKI